MYSCMVVLTFETVVEILKCDHSNESYRAVVSYMVLFMLYKAVPTFESVDEILKCDWPDIWVTNLIHSLQFNWLATWQRIRQGVSKNELP